MKKPKVKNLKISYLGDPVYCNERGQFFKDVGNTRLYLNGMVTQKIKEKIKKRERK